MAEIRILHSAHEGSVKLNLNGETFTLQLPRDNSNTSVPDRFLPLLADSNIAYEIVAPSRDEAGAGAGGDSGAASAEALDGTQGPGPEPTPGVESPTFDASSNTAMPASPPNPSPSSGADPAGKATEGKVAKPKKAPAGKSPKKAKAK